MFEQPAGPRADRGRGKARDEEFQPPAGAAQFAEFEFFPGLGEQQGGNALVGCFLPRRILFDRRCRERRQRRPLHAGLFGAPVWAAAVSRPAANATDAASRRRAFRDPEAGSKRPRTLSTFDTMA